MTDQMAGNPMSEGAHQAARMTAEVAGVLLMGLQHMARVREQQEQERQAKDQTAVEVRRAELRAEHARDRLGWASALEADFSAASATEAARVWTAAQPWVAHDTTAAEAARRAEERLSELHPDLMARYGAHTKDGMEPSEAMLEASHDLARDLYDPFLPPIPFRGVDARLNEVRNHLGVEETLHAWDAARLWAPRDEEAREAMRTAEEKLRRLRPIAMTHYDERLVAGDEPEAAMQAVIPELQVRDADPVAKAAIETRVMTPAEAAAYMAEHPRFAERVEQRGRELIEEYGDRLAGGGQSVSGLVSQAYPEPFGRSGDLGAADAVRSVACEQRETATQEMARPDLRSTPSVDEHAEGVHVATRYGPAADTNMAQAAALAAQAFPGPVVVRSTSPRATGGPRVPAVEARQHRKR